MSRPLVTKAMHGTRPAFWVRASSVVASLILSAASPLSAFAAPSISARQAQAAEIQAQVAQLDTQLEIVVERYNVARSRLDSTQQASEQTRGQLVAAKRRLYQRQVALSRRVRGIYRDGDVTFVEVALSSANFLDFVEQLDMLVRIGQHDAGIVSDIKQTKRTIERRKARLAVMLTERRKVAAAVGADRQLIEGRVAQRKSMLAGIQGEIAALQRRQAAEQAALRRAAERRISRGGGGGNGGGGNGGGGTFHPTGNSHADVVQVAMDQLGKPYEWGASGPGSFDCSGLTMYCYGKIGISLSHSSAAQFSEGQRVGRSELEPGDLVFFGSPIHHVGIYIGGGQFIHSPNTGDVVKISTLDNRGDFAGGCRP
jgi:cell wall-associated NlpC family hydrolase